MRTPKLLLAAALIAPLLLPIAAANATQSTPEVSTAGVQRTLVSESIMREEVVEYSVRVIEDSDITKGIEFTQQEGSPGKEIHLALEYVDSDGNHVTEYETRLIPPTDKVVVKGSSKVISGVHPDVIQAEKEKKRKKEEEAERKRQEEQQQQQQQRNNAPNGSNVPDSSANGVTSPAENRDYAQTLVTGEEFTCMDTLVMRESGWSTTAQNASSGAYGVPQSLPGNKMASHGSDWQTNGKTQVRWMISYVEGRYGTFCNALSHSYAKGWY